jgi:GTP 3',8-cyclase
MKDGFGRTVSYLRISVTEDCDLGCLYCRAGSAMPSSESRLACLSRSGRVSAGPLSAGDFVAVVSAAARLGVDKVRITGGEPLLREDILDIVSGIAAVPGLRDLALTTNGTGLSRLAAELKRAGLGRVNVSLDSLDPGAYALITGGGDLGAVLGGIEDAKKAGLSPLRINTVLVRGINDGGIGDFIALTRAEAIDVRFIELMPISPDPDLEARMVSSAEILASHPELVPDDPSSPDGPGAVARYYRVPGFRGRVGFISPMTGSFCSGCNRLRLRADGRLRPCLGSRDEVDLLPALRSDPGRIGELLALAIGMKPERHLFGPGFSPDRTMDSIGG